ncbi:MAG: hypothetical protein PSW75_09930 [bacterium]|nr:hypothetical protein [bacterium]
MKTLFFYLLSLSLLSSGCTKKPQSVLIDMRKIEASLADRKEWVREQKRLARPRFEEDYGWLLAAKKIEAKEAMQIGYLFFYSSGSMCGYLDNPRLSGGIWRLDYHPGLPPSEGNPIFVDAHSGEVWQESQKRVDALALIRHK